MKTAYQIYLNNINRLKEACNKTKDEKYVSFHSTAPGRNYFYELHQDYLEKKRSGRSKK